MRIFRVYCEAAFDHKKMIGAIAFSIVEDGRVLERSTSSEKTFTANLTEMTCIMSALEELISIGASNEDMIYLYTDFKPICDAFDKGWISKWEENGWMNSDRRPVKHRDHWKALRELTGRLGVEFMYEKREAISMLRNLKKQARKRLSLT